MVGRRDIRYLYLKTSKSIGNFLLSAKSREFFLFLFFFLLASGFWLIQTLDNEYETRVTIPVRLRDVPENVVVTTEPEANLKVRIRDKGTMLINYLLSKTFSPLHIDFMVEEGNHVQIPTSIFSRTIANQFSNSTQILQIQPDTLEYYYSTGQSKRVPVRFLGNVTAGPRHYLTDTIFTPDSVLVYAPQVLLDTIHAAYTSPIDLVNVEDTLRREVELRNERGIKFVPSVAHLTLATDMYTEKTVDVELHGINFPPDKQLRAFPSKVSITFRCGLKQFREIDASDFLLLVSYEDLLKLGDSKYTVKLRSIPKGVSNIRFNPAQVDFLIEQTNGESDD